MVLGADLFFALFNNLAIFIALVGVYGYVIARLKQSPWYIRQLLLGLVFGLFAVGCMYAKIPVFKGVIVDQRNAIIALSGFFGGPFAAYLSAAFAGAFRLYLGGQGAFAGVIGVTLAATSGVLLSKRHQPFVSIPKAVTSAFLATIFILPGFLFVQDFQTGLSLLKSMSGPYGLAIFLGIFTVGLLLQREENKIEIEQLLRESEDNFRLLLNSTVDAIFGIDTKGNCTFCNPACLKILDYASDADLLGKNMHNLIHHHRLDGSEYPANECKIYQAFRKGKGTHIDNEVLWRADGSLFNAEYTSYPMCKGEEVVGAVVIFRDISERKKTQQDLLEAKKAAEEASQTKSEFLAKMSHEIRTPMSVFMSAIEHLQDIDRDPGHKQLLELAALSSERLYNLIEEVLDFSKIESHKLELYEETFDLRECLQGPLQMMQPKAQEKNLALKLEVSPSVPNDIVGDCYRLGQILLNLIDNALKFTEEGQVCVSVSRDGSSLVFNVSDTGTGIPEEKLESIFEDFKQADNSITRKYGGAGLGLAISRGLVELMGGRIKAKSQLGQGSTFTFNLPTKTLQSHHI